jgi:DNA-binding IclR family transcriptional regulator
VPEGTIRFLTQSSTGWMLLSSLDDEAIFKVLKRINAKVQDRSQKVQIEPFMKEMAKVRRDGYCYVPHLPIRNAGAVSMLVNTKSPPYQFVICAGGLVDRLEQNMRTIIKKMRTAIDRFSD